MEQEAITYKLQEFEGPLSLLLNMIQQEELDITQVSLASVADQFVLYIESNPQITGAELTDFLLVATQLLLLKSSLLLPKVEIEDDIDPQSLQTQLKLYKRFVLAAERLEAKIQTKSFLYTKNKSSLKTKAKFSPPKLLSTQNLIDAMASVLKRLEPVVILDESVIERTVTLHQKMLDIRELITSKAKLKKGASFKAILQQSTSKMEQIVSFLALLELVKQEEVDVKQVDNFADISIHKRAE